MYISTTTHPMRLTYRILLIVVMSAVIGLAGCKQKEEPGKPGQSTGQTGQMPSPGAGQPSQGAPGGGQQQPMGTPGQPGR